MQTTGKGAPVVEIHLPKSWVIPIYGSSLAEYRTEATEAFVDKKHLSNISNLPILNSTFSGVKVEK
jgi:hypothetical protein